MSRGSAKSPSATSLPRWYVQGGLDYRHRMTKDRELIHLELRLVSAIDSLVGDQSGSTKHIGRHSAICQGCSGTSSFNRSIPILVCALAIKYTCLQQCSAYPNEQHNILCLPHRSKITDKPRRSRLRAVIVGQSCCVFARLTKRHTAIDLCCNVHQGWSLGIARKVVFVEIQRWTIHYQGFWQLQVAYLRTR